MYKHKNGYAITVFSSILLLTITLVSVRQKNDWIFVVFCFILLISGISIYFLWRYFIKRSYMTRIREREIANLESIIHKQNLTINKLEAEHDRLSQIVHRDNKIIPSLIMYVNEIATINNANEHPRINEIKDELHDIMSERASSSNSSDAQAFFSFKSSISSLDAVVNYMINKASDSNISLGTSLNTDINYLSPALISAFELSTIIADLLENAIIACKDDNNTNKGGMINLEINKNDNEIFIRISDNGIPFDEKVLSNLGKMRITSRRKQGGSGIGMFNTIHILKEAKASISILDGDNNPFTKDILITFDNKSMLIINHNHIEYTVPLP